MTIKVLEHDGIYTAHRLVVRRSDDGTLHEAIKRITLNFPPPDESRWPEWAKNLSEDELEVNLQVFFDRWNFGDGKPGEGRIYQHLCNERQRRKIDSEHPLGDLGVLPGPANTKRG